jgi:hypothetical protein
MCVDGVWLLISSIDMGEAFGCPSSVALVLISNL